MILLFLPHRLIETILWNIVVPSEVLSQIFSSPVMERATMMFFLFGSWSSYDISAILRPLLLPLSNQAICMLYIIHMRFEIWAGNFAGKRSMEELFIIVYIHATTFQEEPQLSSALMFQMVILLELCGEVEHARREESFPQTFNVLYCQLELIVDQAFVIVWCIERIQGFPDESAHLIFYVIFKKVNHCHSHLFELSL